MAVIHKIVTYKINPELAEDIRKKLLSEEDITHYYEKLTAERKKLARRLKILCIVMVSLALVFGIGTYISTDEVFLSVITSVLLMVITAVTVPLAWHANIGKISHQWNYLIKSYYSQISDKYTL